MKQIQKGFTLIELMIVVAIIGILAAVAIPAYQDYVIKAKLSKVQTTIDPVKMALALYYQEVGSFPVDADTVTTATAGNATVADNLFRSIGLETNPAIPNEVNQMVVTGTAANATIALTLDNIKAAPAASQIDDLVITITGTPTSTTIGWSCTAATVTNKIALKYFGCPGA